MKRIICIAISMLILAVSLSAERWNYQVTIVSGTPQRIAVGPTPFYVDRLMIQSKHANTGIIYVMLGVPITTTCNAAATAPYQLTAELGPGDATHPGGTMSDPQGAPGNAISEAEDLRLACVDGTVSSDIAVITGWHKN